MTLAHRGVLFLDELGEFSRSALEALRQPLEEGRIEITRAQQSIVFPAAAMLVGACNSCPCARQGDECRCTAVDRARYDRRLSGPLLDRIDLVCELPPVPSVELVDPAQQAERSSSIRERVVAARDLQRARLVGTGFHSNAEMPLALSRRHVQLGPRARTRMLEGHGSMAITARGHHRVLRLARTIADLEGGRRVEADHVDEALGFRLRSFNAEVAA